MSLNSFRNGLGNITSSPVGKWSIFIVGALLVFSLVFSGLGNNLRNTGGAAGQPGAAADVVATVNGDPITRGEYEQQVESFRNQAQQIGQSISVLKSALLHDTALEQIISARLQVQQAKKMGLTVSDTDIQRQRQQLVQQAGFAQQLSLPPTASVTDIDAALTQKGLPTIEQRLPDDDIRQNVLLDKLQTLNANKIIVTEQDARLSFRQWHTRHILIGNKTRSDVQAQAQAQQILAKAKAPGADFAALARQYTDDTASKSSGGDDGFIDQTTQYVPEFKTAAFALKPGEVTLAKSPQYGWFIIKADAVRDNIPKDFDKNKAQYIAQVKEQKQQEAQQAFLASLQTAPGTSIVVKDPQLRADRAVAQAAQASDPIKQQAAYKTALADYQTALKANPPATVAGEINASMAQIDQSTQQTPQAIAAYEAALRTTADPQLSLALGTLYMKAGQNDKAVAQFQSASQQAWDDQKLHQTLLMAYLQMKRPDLAKQETDWMKQYQQRQQQASLPPGMGASGGGAVSMPQASASPAPSASNSGANTAVPVKNVPDTGVRVVPSDAPGATVVLPAKK